MNLERSLKIGDELGGHHRHRACRRRCRDPRARGGDGRRGPLGARPRASTSARRASLAAFIAEKGSVALDGTSLTVNAVDGRRASPCSSSRTRSPSRPGASAGQATASISRSTSWRATPRGLPRRQAGRATERPTALHPGGGCHRRIPMVSCRFTTDRRAGADPRRARARRRGALLRRHRRRAPARSARGARGGRRRGVEVLTVAGRARNPAGDRHRPRAARRPGAPYDAVVALGCVIRGETFHYDIVAGESARALMDLVGRAPHPARQRHPHRRERGSGLAPGARRRAEQGRRRGRGGAGACSRIKRASHARMTAHGEARRAQRRPPRRRAGALPDGRRPARASSMRSPSSRRSGSAARSRGSPSSRPRTRFFRDILSGVVERAARHRRARSTRRWPTAGP